MIEQTIESRRDRMLIELVAQMKRVHHRRRVRRRLAIASIAPLLCIAVLAGWLFALSSSSESLQPTEGMPPSNARIFAIIERVQSDPSIVERWQAAPSQTADVLDDDSLIETLALIDRPAGLIRSGGRAWLTHGVAEWSGDRRGG